MNQPPPLPKESALTTYSYCGLLLLPLFVAWVFALIFLMPRVDTIWSAAGIDGKRPDFLMQITDHVFHRGRLVILGVVLLLVVLEFCSSVWRTRLRKPVMYLTVFLVLCGILAGYASMTIAALVAAPIHVENGSQAKEAEPASRVKGTSEVDS